MSQRTNVVSAIAARIAVPFPANDRRVSIIDHPPGTPVNVHPRSHSFSSVIQASIRGRSRRGLSSAQIRTLKTPADLNARANTVRHLP